MRIGPAITCSTSAASSTVSRERADLIERRSKGEQAVSRHPAVGRLEADDPAEAPRAGESIRRCRSRAPRRNARGHRHGRAAADPPGVRVVVPWILRRPERRVLGGRAHRELVEVRLADDDGAGGFQSRDRRSRCMAARSRSRIRDDAVVGTPRVQMLSLSATGTPAAAVPNVRASRRLRRRARPRARGEPR